MNIDWLLENIVSVFLPALFFLILGIYIFIKNNKNRQNEVVLYRNKYIPLILSCIPIYISLFIIVRHFFKDIAFALMLLPIFIIVIIYVLITIIIEMVKSFSKKYKETEGTVVTYSTTADHESSSGTLNHFETIKYTVNGKTYYYTDSMSAPLGSKIGKKRILKYNPANPSDCVVKGRYISRIAFLIVFGFMLYILIRILISTF